MTSVHNNTAQLSDRHILDIPYTQNNIKKIQKSNTLERDAAVKELKEQVFKIRNFVKACFSGKPEILVQFNPIPKGRGAGSGEEEKPPENPAPPAK